MILLRAPRASSRVVSLSCPMMTKRSPGPAVTGNPIPAPIDASATSSPGPGTTRLRTTVSPLSAPKLMRPLAAMSWQNPRPLCSDSGHSKSFKIETLRRISPSPHSRSSKMWTFLISTSSRPISRWSRTIGSSARAGAGPPRTADTNRMAASARDSTRRSLLLTRFMIVPPFLSTASVARRADESWNPGPDTGPARRASRRSTAESCPVLDRAAGHVVAGASRPRPVRADGSAGDSLKS